MAKTPAFAAANNDFAVSMYGLLRLQPGNLFFSPFSLRTALAMTEAGARGETAAQMREALRISSSNSAAHAGFAEFVQRLLAAGGAEYELAVANSLWGQEGAPVQPAFLDLIARRYGGGLNLVDFLRAAEAARTNINRWVEDQTKRRIRELIPIGSVDSDTRLVLVNAIYFKGLWLLRFPKAATRAEAFHLDDGGTVRAPLMRQREEIRYLQGTGYQAVDLAYRGDDLSMLVLLPDRQDGLQELEQALSTQWLADCVARMRVREVELFLPKFKITWGTVEMRSQLAALGMTLAFQPYVADFSGINGYEPPLPESLFISAVFHKAFVAVDEEGTEAAAATAVIMRAAGAAFVQAPPVPVFRADHPFLFAIRDRRSGAILFLGRVADPT